MKSKWYNGLVGVESITTASEFVPRKYKVRIVGLGKFGVPEIPAVGQVSYRKLDEPSPWHGHRGCIEFVYCAAGACEYESEGKIFRLSPGMMFVSRPEEVHRQLDCPKGYATYYLHFRLMKNSVSRWFAKAFADIPRLFACGRSIPARFSRILSLAESGRPGTELGIRLRTEVHSLFLDILDSTARTVKQGVPRVFDDIAARIRTNPAHEYPLDDLVAESGVSKASFISLFKSAHGYSPHAFLLFCRVEEAKELLAKGVAIRTAAERLGFLSTQQFTRTFRNFMGVSPKRWIAEKA